MTHQIFKTLAIAVPLAIAGCKTTDDAERPSNPGSHLPLELYNEVIAGRTVIQFESWTGDWKNWFVTSASYHVPGGGGTMECWGKKRRYRSEVETGHSTFTQSGEDWFAAMNFNDGTVAPVFYNPETGRLHVEEWDERNGRWEIMNDGWVQEGWPRLMADACPDLTDEILARGGWIREKQTHPTIYTMLEQDPSAPLALPAVVGQHSGLAAEAENKAFWWCFESPSKPVLPTHCFPDGQNHVTNVGYLTGNVAAGS